MVDKHGSVLQTIFWFFLGLMVAAFVGVGVLTFYPSPEEPFTDRIDGLERQESAILAAKPDDALTPADRAKLRSIKDEIDRVGDARDAAVGTWSRHTSMMLIALATIAMAISLIRAAQLAVISNGLLFGGVVTMIYGVGWIIASDQTIARFLVITVALAITLALGYLRFVRRREPVEILNQARILGGEGLVDLEQRVTSLEDRMDEAASAFRHKGGRSRDS